MCVESLLASGGIRFAVRPFARPGGVASPSETLQCRRARNRRACQWVWACCCMRGTPCPMETAFQTTASVERPAVLGAKRTTGEFRSWRVDSPFGWQLPSQTSGLKHLHQAHPKQGSAVHRLLQASGSARQQPLQNQAHQIPESQNLGSSPLKTTDLKSVIDDSKSFTINGKTIILVNVALQVFLDRLISDRSRTEGCIANPPEVSAPKLCSHFRKFSLDHFGRPTFQTLDHLTDG